MIGIHVHSRRGDGVPGKIRDIILIMQIETKFIYAKLMKPTECFWRTGENFSLSHGLGNLLLIMIN